MNKVFIIAEAGVNHNGDINIAKRLIDNAKEVGADAVKFQTWITELIVTPNAELAEYQSNNIEKGLTQYEMLKNLELSFDDFKELKQYCDEVGIMFLSTADEEESAAFLNGIQSIFKIGSGELTNIPFLQYIASLKKDVILSTGMGTLGEIEMALNTLLGHGLKREQICILHATTEYPAPYEELNLRAINTIKEAFNVKVGYSDHSLGIEAAIASVTLGAEVIEKHFTLDKNMDGPDHLASIEPDEFKQLVKAIRNIEIALGHGRKEPSKTEIKNKKIVQKSIIALKDIEEGEVFSNNNIGFKRPSGGLSPAFWKQLIGKKSPQSFKKDEFIKII